jgi:hypothetical protein
MKAVALGLYLLLAALAWRWSHLLQLVPLTLLFAACWCALAHDNSTWQGREAQIVDAFFAVVLVALAMLCEIVVLFI